MSELFVNVGNGKFLNDDGKAKKFRKHNDGLMDPVDESEEIDLEETDETLDESEVDVREARKPVNEGRTNDVISLND